MLTLEHALSSNADRIVQQRAVMIISNRVHEAGHAASGHIRIAVKEHESKARKPLGIGAGLNMDALVGTICGSVELPNAAIRGLSLT